jgi:ABC-type multidrug transport system permease subunit
MSEQKAQKPTHNLAKPKIDFTITFLIAFFFGLIFEYHAQFFLYFMLEFILVIYLLGTFLRPNTPRAEDAPLLGSIIGLGIVVVTGYLINFF